MRDNPAFTQRIARLRLELAPLVSLSHNSVHPAFPRTLLHFSLLTEAELDQLAHFYDQSTPTELTYMYPVCMRWDKEFLSEERERDAGCSGMGLWTLVGAKGVNERCEVTIHSCPAEQVSQDRVPFDGGRGLCMEERVAIKKRMFGKFIGLRGMETPMVEVQMKIRWLEERMLAAIEADRNGRKII